MTALSATVQRRAAPLPTPFRLMADAIAGPRPVMLSTDEASAGRCAGPQDGGNHGRHDPPRPHGSARCAAERGRRSRTHPHRSPVACASFLRRHRRQPRGAPRGTDRERDGAVAACTVVVGGGPSARRWRRWQHDSPHARSAGACSAADVLWRITVWRINVWRITVWRIIVVDGVGFGPRCTPHWRRLDLLQFWCWHRGSAQGVAARRSARSTGRGQPGR